MLSISASHRAASVLRFVVAHTVRRHQSASFVCVRAVTSFNSTNTCCCEQRRPFPFTSLCSSAQHSTLTVRAVTPAKLPLLAENTITSTTLLRLRLPGSHADHRCPYDSISPSVTAVTTAAFHRASRHVRRLPQLDVHHLSLQYLSHRPRFGITSQFRASLLPYTYDLSRHTIRSTHRSLQLRWDFHPVGTIHQVYTCIPTVGAGC